MSSVTRTYFTLSVVDMARAVAFYQGVLGPVVRVESPTWSELKLGEATVALHTTPVPSPRYTGLGVEVVDLHAAYHAITALGGKVLSGPSPDPTASSPGARTRSSSSGRRSPAPIGSRWPTGSSATPGASR